MIKKKETKKEAETDEEIFVRICPMCKSKNIKPPSGGVYAAFDAYGISSMTGLMLCGNCGRMILPIEVSEGDYKRLISAADKKLAGDTKSAKKHK